MQAIAKSQSVNFIQKLSFILLLAIAFPVAAWAQPTVTISDVSANNGENVCIPITVENFTLVTDLQMSIQYDPLLIDYTGANEDMLTGVTFTPNEAEGVIIITWNDGNCEDNNNVGVTLPDGSVIFDLCFDAIGPYGSISPLEVISDNEPPFVPFRMYRQTTNCINILPFRENGSVTIGLRPFTLSASTETGNPGDLVCVDVIVEQGWDELNSMQFSMGWDNSFMLLENIIAGDGIPNFNTASNTAIPANSPGCMTVSWASVPTQDAPSVPDGELFFQLCFRIVGDCEASSTVEIKNSPTPIEITNRVEEGLSLPLLSDDGLVRSSDCDQIGIEVAADCGGPVNLNEEICVAVVAGTTFQDINNLNFLMEWNSSILQFDRVQAFNLPTLNASMFDTGNTDNGILSLDEWDIQPSAGQDRDPGETLFEVCFDVIGLGGNSPFNIIPGTGEQGGSNMNIVPTNCEVQVIQPAGVTMILGDMEAPPGGNSCVPVTVSNFQDILSYQFSLNWDATLWTYVSTENNVIGMDVGDTGAGSGSLFYDFEDTNPVSLPDNDVLMEICFTPAITAVPGDCDTLEIIALPLVAEAITTNSNGNDIGVTAVAASMCVLFPEGFGLTGMDTDGLWMEPVCMPFTVQSFDNITDASFCLNFSPSNFEFVAVNPSGSWPGLTFNTDDANLGLICADFSSATPLMIAEDEVVFELCLEPIGVADTCFTIGISPEGTPPVTTDQGQGSLVVTEGELCIEDQLIITNVDITPESCPGSMDGQINLTVISAGDDVLGTSWQTEQPQFVPLMATDLSAGEVIFTIFEVNNNPALTLTDTVTVGIAGPSPTVTISQDTFQLGCDPPQVLISADGPDTLSVEWFLLTGGNPQNLNFDTYTIFASNPGPYMVVVRDPNTGCEGRDTAFVLAPQLPTAVIDTFQTTNTTGLDCSVDTLFLDARLFSSQGDFYDYIWTASQGGMIAADTETEPVVGILTPGRYQLVLRNRITGCLSEQAELIVTGEGINVDAEAGLDAEQFCDGSLITFSGINSNNPGLNPTFAWFDGDGMLLSNNVEVQVSELGTYILEVTDPITGCSGLDSVQIVANEGALAVSSDPADAITCIQDTVMLSASVSPPDADFDFTWTAIDGGMFVSGTDMTLTPQVTEPGRYVVTIINNDNQCESTDTVNVANNMLPPNVEAGDAQELNCTLTQVTLSANGSDTGDDISYQWFFPDLMSPIEDATDDTYEATTAGIYYLELTNSTTGCVGVDSVEVMVSGDVPGIVADDLEQMLSCANPSVDIAIMVEPDTISFTTVWVALNGSPFTQNDDLSITTMTADTFRVTVTNTATGCDNEQDFVVTDEGVLPPAIVIADNNFSINCVNTNVTIDASGSPDLGDLSFMWSTDDGETPTPDDEAMLTVSTPGTYTLAVTNDVTGCVNDTMIVIADLTTPPVVDTLPADIIGCLVNAVSIGVTVSGSTDFVVNWVGLDGGTPMPATGNPVEVTEAGTYQATVRDTISGCETVASIEVTSDANAPQIVFDAEPDDFGCTDTSVTLDASASGNPADFTSITWVSLGTGTVTPATGSLVVEVSAAGEYTLTLESANGCTTTDTISVDPDEDTPMALAGDDLIIECDLVPDNLDGSQSSQGDNITYEWTKISGEGDLVGDVNTLFPEISGPGEFLLTVRNTDNGCEATDMVSVSLEFPEDAMAGMDISTCDNFGQLTANLPAGTSGVWTSDGTAMAESPNNPATLISGLTQGSNTFTWTLSAPGCADYSSDQVVITQASAPVALGDQLQLTSTNRFGEVNLVANDQLNGATNFSISLLTEPTFGVIDTLAADGTLSFSAPLGVSGVTDIEYEICNDDCPDLCATGTLTISVEDDGREPQLPNTITPNGDNLNDLLVFDVLLFNPAEEFPDNQIVIFNRWGDVVFEDQPYNNNWGGLSEDGTELPEGTYYYVLRLNIAEGIIYRGDITIVR